MAEVILEPFAEGMEEGTIHYWYHEEGDHVDEGSDLVEIISEAGTFKVISPCSGILGEVFFGEGDTVSIGDILCEIEEG
ncbi:MAG: hypothetical protein HY583_01825 [Candidatus Omnitrophica bacterium]|nr:hypothetical protein [Candidatus Omnitrophota bacterium]